MSILKSLSPLLQGPPASAPQDPKQALLAQLAEAAAPAPISFWPLAFGWWILIAIIVMCICLLAFTIIKKLKQNRYRKIALNKLSHIQTQYQQHKNRQLTLEQITTLTKQVCLTCDTSKKNNYASLHGKHWWQNLNIYMKKPLSFEDIPFESLYQATPSLTSEQLAHLFVLTKIWIKHHNIKYSQHNPIKNEVQHV